MKSAEKSVKQTKVPNVRLDMLLVERGLVESREQAQRLILAGKVEVSGVGNLKAGMRLPQDAQIRVAEGEKYVSRGGLKLEAALERFGVEVQGKVCADIGASTGGFSDCLLQRGAARVYAVDVGKSQLHARVRNDARVILVEQTNARELKSQSLPEAPELIVVDVSFISLGKILPALAQVAGDHTQLVTLVKPQFEATRVEVSRGRGVIKDPGVYHRVLDQVGLAAWQSGWKPLALMPSPIAGGSGNREFLMHLSRFQAHEQQELSLETLRNTLGVDAVVAQACMVG